MVETQQPGPLLSCNCLFSLKMYSHSLVLYLCVGVLVQCAAAGDWCYQGCYETPSRWKEFATTCGEKRQSPIDIITHNVEVDETLTNFTFLHFSSKTAIKTFSNTGHTVKYKLEEGQVEVSGGGLDGHYSAIQFHFHWGGSTDHHPGSEHTIDGHRYPMEMHIVTFKKGLNATEAVNQTDGIAVLAFFINATEDGSESEAWKNLTLNITKDNETYMQNYSISIDDLIGNVDLTKFYRYNGSLTTPQCDEAVVWTVFHEPITISRNLIDGFPEKTDLTNTYRPTQDLNERKVLGSPALFPSHHWCYDHHCGYSPDHWENLPNSKCGEDGQSPINITTNDVIEDSSLNSFTFTKFDDKHAITSVINTGHTAKFVLEDDMVEVSGGGLDHVYSTLQFHFHWGDAHDSDGSEHMVNSKRYPMEMHIVNKRKDLSLDEALGARDGLAVLGFFIEAAEKSKSSSDSSGHDAAPSSSSSTYDAWHKLTSYLAKINDSNNKIDFTDELSIDDLLGDVNRHEYYRYNGSLTTPTCNEAVVWTVFKQSIKVDHNLMMMFPEQLKYHNVYRPAQPLNDRKIYSTSASCIPAPIIWLLLLMSVCAFWL